MHGLVFVFMKLVRGSTHYVPFLLVVTYLGLWFIFLQGEYQINALKARP
jgi:hypothetical protein